MASSLLPCVRKEGAARLGVTNVEACVALLLELIRLAILGFNFMLTYQKSYEESVT